jgi:hypothetical protein
MVRRGVQGIASAAYLEGFPFSGLLSVAPYCVPDGIRVVSRVRALALPHSLACLVPIPDALSKRDISHRPDSSSTESTAE